jgi:zinc/manganese transport system substrate-binding protein
MRAVAWALALVLVGFVTVPQASAEVRVVTTTTDLAWAAREVGGDHVRVRALCSGNEDPHFVSPTPSLVAAVGDADLFVEVGLSLEIWSERLLDGAGNPGVRRGAPGYVSASQGVMTLERPTALSRSQGDLHPEGNPHVWLDPLAMKKIASNIAEGLARVDLENAADYRARSIALGDRIDRALYGDALVELLGSALLDRLARGGQLETYLDRELGGTSLRSRLGGWLKRAATFQGEAVVTTHQSWIYFATRFGLEIADYIEEKPGIQPSVAHRRHVVEQMRARNIPLVVVTNYYGPKIPAAIARDAGAEVASVPLMTGGSPEAATWFDLMNHLVDVHAAAYGKTP